MFMNRFPRLRSDICKLPANNYMHTLSLRAGAGRHTACPNTVSEMSVTKRYVKTYTDNI